MADLQKQGKGGCHLSQFLQMFFASLFNTVLCERRMRYSLSDGLCFTKSLYCSGWSWVKPCWDRALLVLDAWRVRLPSLLKSWCNSFWKYNWLQQENKGVLCNPECEIHVLAVTLGHGIDGELLVLALRHYRAQTYSCLSKNCVLVNFASLSITCQSTLDFCQSRYCLSWSLPKSGVKK